MQAIKRVFVWPVGLILIALCSSDISSIGLEAPLSYRGARVYPAGLCQHSLVIDLTLDGVPDLAAVELGGTCLVLPGQGDGSFGPGARTRVGDDPRSVAAADFNHDGKPDLAVANAESDSVSILLGRGDGTFAAADFASGPGPISVACADLDEDGNLDLAVACQGKWDGAMLTNGGCMVLRGNGDGSFQAPVRIASLGELTFVATGDLNGDKHLDLALARRGEYHYVQLDWPPHSDPVWIRTNGLVSIFLNKGDGRFDLKSTSEVFTEPKWIALGDWSSDGKPDLAVACYAGPGYEVIPGLSVLRGVGDGTFAPAITYGTGGLPRSVAMADLDRDGLVDVVVSSDGFGMRDQVGVSILYGKPGGELANPQLVGGPLTTGGTECVAAADLNRDDKLDLVTTGYGEGVCVMLQTGAREFAAAEVHALQANFSGVAMAQGDLNRDGVPDIVNLVNTTDSPCRAFSALGSRNGVFTWVYQQFPEWILQAAIGDVNGDGYTDLLAVNQSRKVRIYPGNGTGVFGEPVLTSVVVRTGGLTAVDLTGDGKTDLLSNDDTGFDVFPAQSGGAFGEAITYNVQPDRRIDSLVQHDFDRDGIPDVAVLEPSRTSTNTIIEILRGNGDGSFSFLTNLPLPGFSGTILVADLNRDSKVDFLVNDPTAGKLAALFGRADGSFQPPVLSDFGGTVLHVLDLNGDGLPDIAGRGPFVAVGKGDGTFGVPQGYLMGKGPEPLLVGDFNLDGKPDLASIVNRPDLGLGTFCGMSVLWNTSLLPLRLVGGVSTNGLTLAWPATTNEFRLEGTSSLLSTNWQPVSGSPAVSNGRFEITLPFATGQRFFRLRLPGVAQ